MNCWICAALGPDGALHAHFRAPLGGELVKTARSADADPAIENTEDDEDVTKMLRFSSPDRRRPF